MPTRSSHKMRPKCVLRAEQLVSECQITRRNLMRMTPCCACVAVTRGCACVAVTRCHRSLLLPLVTARPMSTLQLCHSVAFACAQPISHITSHVTRHTSHVTRHTSHVTRHTSHVTHLTSHVTRRTSHVSHSLSVMMSWAAQPLNVLQVVTCSFVQVSVGPFKRCVP